MDTGIYTVHDFLPTNHYGIFFGNISRKLLSIKGRKYKTMQPKDNVTRETKSVRNKEEKRRNRNKEQTKREGSVCRERQAELFFIYTTLNSGLAAFFVRLSGN